MKDIKEMTPERMAIIRNIQAMDKKINQNKDNHKHLEFDYLETLDTDFLRDIQEYFIPTIIP